MRKRPLVAVAAAVLVGGIAALVVASTADSDVQQSVAPSTPHLAAAYPRAAAAAYGRRVLVVHAPPLDTATAEILESVRAGGGWELHAPAPSGAQRLESALAALAADAAADWDDDRALDAGTVERLARAAVAIVVVEDGDEILLSERAAETAGLAPESSVPALRVRAAEPVRRVDGEEDGPDGRRPRLVPARARELDDDRWGGSVVVEAEAPGRFVIAWPSEGGRVTVDGRVVEPMPAVGAFPFVTLDLPAGDSRVEVRFRRAGGAATWAIAGALAVVVSLVVLLLALRPHPEREDGDTRAGDAAP